MSNIQLQPKEATASKELVSQAVKERMAEQDRDIADRRVANGISLYSICQNLLPI